LRREAGWRSVAGRGRSNPSGYRRPVYRSRVRVWPAFGGPLVMRQHMS